MRPIICLMVLVLGMQALAQEEAPKADPPIGYADADHDGVNDRFRDADGDGVEDVSRRPYPHRFRFVDQDEDGINDLFVDQDGDGVNDLGAAYVDRDKDGICDNIIDFDANGLGFPGIISFAGSHSNNFATHGFFF